MAFDIKDIIKKEVKNIFNSNACKIELDEVVDLFINIVKYPLDDPSANLDGIETRLFTSIATLFKQDSSIDMSFSDFVKFEPFLRKVLYLVDKPQLKTIESGKKGLVPLIKALNLNPESKNISGDPESLLGEKYYVEHLCRAYHLRNKESHHCVDFSKLELAQNIQSVLVVYIYTTFLHMNKINHIIDANGVNKYLKNEVDNFIQWKESFVHIDGKELFEIDLYAKEISLDEENSSSPERQGTIDFLRNNIPEKQMVILGEVGTGKSTTLQYLHYKDAELCLSGNSYSIPVYIELKYVTGNENIICKMVSKLNVETSFVEKLLKKGRLNILLDGLNEIDRHNRISVFRQIDRLMTDFPLNQFLITSRPLSYNREFDNNKGRTIPVFVLQGMEDKQIEEFLDRNGHDVKNKILSEITINEKLKEIVTNPLILKMLINVVRRTNTIPQNKALIIKEFIYNILKREKKVEHFDEELYYLLLRNWAFKSRLLTNSNSGLDQLTCVIPFFNNLKNEIGKTDFDIWDFIKKIRDIYILTKENNLLTFTHELYQEYFSAEFLHFERNKITDDELIKKYTDPHWEEVIILYSGLITSAEERGQLIKEITDTNPFLGFKCESNSILKNIPIESYIVQCAKEYINKKNDEQLTISSILALIGFNQYEYIIEFVKKQTGANIPTMKSIVSSVLKGNIKNDDLWGIIKVFIESNSYYYMSDINRFIADNKDSISFDYDSILEIIKSILLSSTKFHQIVSFLKLTNINNISVVQINESYVLEVVAKSNNINDILYFIKTFNLNISSVKIIQTIISKGESSSLFMLKYYMDALRGDLREILIKDLLSSEMDTRIAVGLIFMHKYKLQKKFSKYLRSNPMYNDVNNKIRRNIRKNNIDYFEGFMSTLTATVQRLAAIKHLKSLEDNLHQIISCWVLTEFPYHYLLGSKGIHNTKILLPKAEIENGIIPQGNKKKFNVFITFVDKMRNRMYASLIKQEGFKNDYQYILKPNDVMECRINISQNNSYYITPIGLGKDLLKFNFDAGNEYVIKKKYKAKVKNIYHYDNLEIEIMDED